MRKVWIAFITLATLPLLVAPVFALDPPHDPANLVNCADCHTLHIAPGVALTVYAGNANLCMSCHVGGGKASGKPFSDAMQASPGAGGTSHRWDASMPLISDPDNPYGLRAVADLANAELRSRLNMFSDIVTCSICHDPHKQGQTPWDPFASGIVGEAGNKLMQFNNEVNTLCEDCHYYRSAASGRTDVRTWDGSRKSHPTTMNLTTDVTDATQFVGTAPLEPNGNPQTSAPRYHQNGTGDAILTNNIVLDKNGKIGCLSCHGFHYTDSNSATEDVP